METVSSYAGPDGEPLVERHPRGPEARRVASGLADLAARQAAAIAALDRALETRLGELDRAFAVRRSRLESLLADTERDVVDQVDVVLADLRRSGASERRVLREAVAAELAGVEVLVTEYRRRLHQVVEGQQAELRSLVDRVTMLESAFGTSPAPPDCVA